MELIDGVIRLCATDLVGHLNCTQLSQLNFAVVSGARASLGPLLEILWERGARHEQGFVAHLKCIHLANAALPARTGLRSKRRLYERR